MKMARVYAFVADGMEEVECLAVCDCLRRAKVDVKLVSIMGRKMVTGSHGFKIEADCLFEEIGDDADVLFLPGGLVGTNNLKAHRGLAEMLKAHAAAGKRLAAICAAPSVLGELGLVEGIVRTCISRVLRIEIRVRDCRRRTGIYLLVMVDQDTRLHR